MEGSFLTIIHIQEGWNRDVVLVQTEGQSAVCETARVRRERPIIPLMEENNNSIPRFLFSAGARLTVSPQRCGAKLSLC